MRVRLHVLKRHPFLAQIWGDLLHVDPKSELKTGNFFAQYKRSLRRCWHGPENVPFFSSNLGNLPHTTSKLDILHIQIYTWVNLFLSHFCCNRVNRKNPIQNAVEWLATIAYVLYGFLLILVSMGLAKISKQYFLQADPAERTAMTLTLSTNCGKFSAHTRISSTIFLA